MTPSLLGMMAMVLGASAEAPSTCFPKALTDATLISLDHAGDKVTACVGNEELSVSCLALDLKTGKWGAAGPRPQASPPTEAGFTLKTEGEAVQVCPTSDSKKCKTVKPGFKADRDGNAEYAGGVSPDGTQFFVFHYTAKPNSGAPHRPAPARGRPVRGGLR